jgi:hypothetical protein
MERETMRNRWMMGLAGAGVLLAGMLIGALVSGGLPAWASAHSPRPVVAATPAPGDYCQVYENTVVSNLRQSNPNLTAAQLEAANEAGLKAVIAQMYADHKINQAQETQLLAKAQSLSSNPCAALQQMAQQAAAKANQVRGELAGAQAALVAAVAPKLGLSTTQLQADLKGGQTVSQLIAAQHANGGAVGDAYLGALQTQLAGAVKAGTITQQQSDAIYAKIKQAVAAGHYPGLDGGGMGMAAGPGAGLGLNP